MNTDNLIEWVLFGAASPVLLLLIGGVIQDEVNELAGAYKKFRNFFRGAK